MLRIQLTQEAVTVFTKFSKELASIDAAFDESLAAAEAAAPLQNKDLTKQERHAVQKSYSQECFAPTILGKAAMKEYFIVMKVKFERVLICTIATHWPLIAWSC